MADILHRVGVARSAIGAMGPPDRKTYNPSGVNAGETRSGC
jgi:hypothetical protein